MHRKIQDEKEANWVLQTATEADLDLDEDMQCELMDQLGSKAKKQALL